MPGVNVNPLQLVLCLQMLPALYVKPVIPVGVRTGVELGVRGEARFGVRARVILKFGSTHIRVKLG